MLVKIENLCLLEGHLIYILKVRKQVRLLSHVGHYRPTSCSSLENYYSLQSKNFDEVIKDGLPKRGPKCTDRELFISKNQK